MDYQQTIDFLYARLPIFQKQGASALKNGLDGISKLCEHLGHPQNQFKAVHVAGTNGKGSTSHLMASVLQKSGLKTGLYTSPHLVDFRERIRINGEVISESYIIDFITKIKPLIEVNSFSFFEVTVALAFKYFADNQVDIAVIEVGLGGRLDSTNIITPILSIITNISDDHKQILGETLGEIAGEKAGIIKKNVPVVISTKQPEIAQVFVNKAKAENATLYFADEYYQVKGSILNDKTREIIVQCLEKKLQNDSYELDLLGTYQLYNIIGVLQAVDVLRTLKFSISDKSLKLGLKTVVQSTGLMGRWQKIAENPLVICDTGHNLAGITEVLKNIEQQKYKRLLMVIGFVKDKDVANILNLLPKTAHYFFCEANIPRALPNSDLFDLGAKVGLEGQSHNSVAKAYQMAKKQAKEGDFIFVGGSTFVVADFLMHLQENNLKN